MKKKKKRVTLASLLVKALCASAVLIFIFASGFREYLNYEINRQSHDCISESIESYQKLIDKAEVNYSEEKLLKYIDNRLNINGYVEIMLEDPFSYENIYINQYLSDNCHYATALIDENMNIVASNEKELISLFKFSSDNKSNGFYSCDREIINLPEVDKLYDDLQEFMKDTTWRHSFLYDVDSVYVNTENFTFIPHKGTIVRIKDNNPYQAIIGNKNYNDNLTVEEGTFSIDITIDNEDYVIFDKSDVNNEDSRIFFTGMQGEEKEIIDSFEFTSIKKLTDSGATSWEIEDGVQLYKRYETVYINKKPYSLAVGCIIDYNDERVVDFYIKWTVIFGAFVLLAALILVWIEYMKKKTQYAYEDYQRDLTNNLAHDIKTPLMAIGGYTENIMEGNLTESERENYLSHILENISFADSLVNRTLQLNGMSENKPHKEKIKAEEVFEKAINKYTPLLDEKNITYSVKGSCDVNAEPVSFEALVENLVSNAVKYTKENGEIKGDFNKKTITITNSVSEKIDTKDLKMPFVRGDKSRSNAKGSGLGLSIADKAAESNGMTLKIFCTDKEFKAELKM